MSSTRSSAPSRTLRTRSDTGSLRRRASRLSASSRCSEMRVWSQRAWRSPRCTRGGVSRRDTWSSLPGSVQNVPPRPPARVAGARSAHRDRRHASCQGGQHAMPNKLVVALALLLTTAGSTPASLRRTVRRQNHAHRVMCYTSCPFYRDVCRNVFANGCLYKRCTKELVYSCLGNPADAQCARPCSALNPCAADQQCSGGQCIIQPPPGAKCAQLAKLKRPKPPTTEACGAIFCPRGTPYCNHGTSTCVADPPRCPAGFPNDCGTGFCCPSGDTCNATGCCSGQYPVACGNYCCSPGSTCGQGGCSDPCPPD